MAQKTIAYCWGNHFLGIIMNGMRFQKITIENRSSWFLCQGDSSLVISGQVREEFLYKVQKFAGLYKKGDKILKVCFGQSWPKDSIRKYFAQSQAHREKSSSGFLHDLKINAPLTSFMAFSLSPFCQIESLQEMSYLEDYQLLDRQISQRKDSHEIVRLMAEDLSILTNNLAWLKDFGLGNIMYNPEQGVSWIDNDIKKFSSKDELVSNLAFNLWKRFLLKLSESDRKVFWETFEKRSNFFDLIKCKTKESAEQLVALQKKHLHQNHN